jgi:hypothetical protein
MTSVSNINFLTPNISIVDTVQLIKEKIESKTPFALTRFGDGEIYILNNNYSKEFLNLNCKLWGYRFPEESDNFVTDASKIIKKALRIYGNDFIQLKGLGFTCTLEKLIKLKIIGAKFAEVPFILRYDQKVSNSKMISSITTFGYFVITILYYWPFGGWKASYKEKIKKSIN